MVSVCLNLACIESHAHGSLSYWYYFLKKQLQLGKQWMDDLSLLFMDTSIAMILLGKLSMTNMELHWCINTSSV